MPPSLRLTFDDGPGPSTPLLLDVLKDASLKATFFVLGKHLAATQDLAVRMLCEGHTLGNHTWTHARPGDLSADDLIREIEATDALIRAAHRHAGLDAPHAIALRLPYGLQAGDPRRVVLDRLARPHAGWTLIVDDWRRPAPDAQTLAGAMLDHVAAQTASGHDAVICLHDSSPRHDTRPATVEAVQLLLDHADWRGAQ